MINYIARVGLKYDYASEKMPELGTFFEKFVEKIPDEHQPVLKLSRFTFCTVVMQAENVEQCRKILKDVWNEVYPDTDAISDILVSKYTENEPISEIMRSVYNNLYGADEYQTMLTELTELIPIMQNKGAGDIVRRTNYVFAIDRGCGYTTLLSSLGDYIHKMRIYPEEEYEKRLKYYKFELGPDNDNGKTDFDTFLSTLYDDLENHNYNIIGLDISFYLEKSKQDELRNFLHRLETYQDKYVFAFRIPFMEKKAMDETISLLSDVMIVRLVQVPPLHDCVMMETFWNIINDKDYVPDVSLFDIISNKIRQEKTDGRFYGFKTVEKIASEVIIRKTADIVEKTKKGLEADKRVIMPDDLDGYVDEKILAPGGYDALSGMIGMEKIADKIREIIAQVKVSLSEEGPDRPCIHMRFTGAPGTGKTTVARIVGQIMKEEGILRKGAFLEYTGRDLCAEYVGQTAVKTTSICRDSYGSVLFIDEAYALYDSDHTVNDFGKEAITTLVSEMENHRDDMLVVMAGYTDEMNTLMKANPGLRSRMPYVIDFPNYTREQLFKIFMLMVKKHFTYTPEFETEAEKYFNSLSDEMLSSKEFANARFVRNLYERTWSKGALRASLSGSKTIELGREDIVSASSEKEFSEKLTVAKKIGF